MDILFRDYRNNDQYERDKAGNFDGRYAQCTSVYVIVDDHIKISEQHPNGKFRVDFGNGDRWIVGCQHILVIVNDQNEEIYKSPFDDIVTNGNAEMKERLQSVREDLLELQANGWKPIPNEEHEIKKYIDDCDNDYMPDIF